MSYREMKLFQNNYFSLRPRPSEIILFQPVETCILAWTYFEISSRAYCMPPK